LVPFERGANRRVEADGCRVGHDQHPVVRLRALIDRVVPQRAPIPLTDQIVPHEHSQQLDVIAPVAQLVEREDLTVFLQNEDGMMFRAVFSLQLRGQTRIGLGMFGVVTPMPRPRQSHLVEEISIACSRSSEHAAPFRSRSNLDPLDPASGHAATGDIQAHMVEIHDTSISKETISRITDPVLDDVQMWQQRPLDHACTR